MLSDLITRIQSILDIDHHHGDEDILKSIAKKISTEIPVKFITIGFFILGEEPRIATEAFLENGCETDNTTYPLRDAPCGNVIINRKVCLYPRGVAALFPEYLKNKRIESYVGAPILTRNNELTGIISLMDVKPITEGHLMSTLCEFLAIRIGADLDLFRVAKSYQGKTSIRNKKSRNDMPEICKSALINFQKNLAGYQELNENRESGFGIMVVDDLTDWQHLCDQLKANLEKLKGLIGSNSHSKYLVGYSGIYEEIIHRYFATGERGGTYSTEDLPGCSELELIARLLYEQNLRLLCSAKKILKGKKTCAGDRSRLMEEFSQRSGAAKADGLPGNSAAPDKSGGKGQENEPQSLDSVAHALKTFMEQNKVIERDLSGTIKFNLEKIILPDLEKLKGKLAKKEDQDLCRIIMKNLVEITTPLLPSARIDILNRLSPSELRVVNLIKQGHNTKEIGRILNLSPQTIATHRHNIRKKIGLINQKENLFTVLNQS